MTFAAEMYLVEGHVRLLKWTLKNLKSLKFRFGTCRPTFSKSVVKYFEQLKTFIGPGSVIGIATDYGLDGPGIESWWRARFSAPVQTDTGPYPTSYIMGTNSLSRAVKRPEYGVVHPTLSSYEVKERVELYLYSPSGPSWPVAEWKLPFTFTCSAQTQ